MRKVINRILSVCILPLLFIVACSKKADYSEYLKQSEKVYPGRPDSIVVKSGYHKAQISSLLSSDPRVVKMRVFWNSRHDSLDVAVNKSDYSKRKIIDIPEITEGIYTFELITLDAMNHRSVASEKSGRVYGDFYLDGLINRVLKEKKIIDGHPALVWFTETDKDSPINGLSVTYPKAAGDSLTIFTKRQEDITVLLGAAPSGSVTVKTAYLPEDALETFYSAPIKIEY